MTQVAGTLAYVRTTDGGVVQVDEGAALPEGLDAGHVDRLTAAGVLVEPEPALDPPGSDVPPASGPGAKPTKPGKG